MAQESRAKLTVRGSREEAGSPEVKEGGVGDGAVTVELQLRHCPMHIRC